MFMYGKPVSGINFFDRTVVKKQIKQLVANHNDFMIKAPRRYGKTSLMSEVLIDTPHIYLDFRRVPRLSILPEELINQAYDMLDIKGFFLKAKENVFGLIKEVKTSGKIDVGIVELGAEIIFSSKEKTDCEKFIDALKIVDEVSKSLNKKITIVFDEFQDIKRLDCDNGKILEVLRGTLQHTEGVHSVFLGSIESIMTDIFENKKSPFFNYCRKINLKPFDIDEVAKDIIASFRKKKMVFDDTKILRKILNRLQGHPANTMLTMQTLYHLMLEKDELLIKNLYVYDAFERAYFEQLDLVTQYISEMKTKKHYHDVMYRTARGEEQELTSQALYQVRKGLVDIGLLIQDDRDGYVICDSFLEEYLKR